MRQIIYDKVRNISEKYKGYIDTEDLMKEGLTNRQIGLLTAEEKLEKIAHGHYWVNNIEIECHFVREKIDQVTSSQALSTLMIN